MGFPSIDGTSSLSGSGEFSAQSFNSGLTNQSRDVDTIRCPKCGTDVPRAMRNCPNDGTDLLMRIGQIFADKYELLDCVGSGAMGIIYRARHLILDKIVAIKVVNNTNTDPNLIMRFQREAKAASSLNHINVITVYDFGVFEGTAPYMVMDYLRGKTLQEYILQNEHLSLRKTLDIIEQILAALVHAQKKNILHRDLKPGNIMILEDDGEPLLVKILDFGLAKLLDRDDQVSLSAVGAAMGSPAYMSPEQATGLKVDARSDLYSVGCIMYELLTGVPPLMGDSPMETLVNRLNRRVPPVSDFLSDSKRSRAYNPSRETPTIVELFVAKLLERDQRDRFQSAQEARNYLNTIWEYVDVPEANSDSSSMRATRTARPVHARDTVKDLQQLDPNSAIVSSGRHRIGSSSGNQQSISGSDQRPSTSTEIGAVRTTKPRSTRQSYQDLRKIQADKAKSPAQPHDASSSASFDLETLIRNYEHYSHRLIEIIQQFHRSNPGLYRIAVILAITALVTVILILR